MIASTLKPLRHAQRPAEHQARHLTQSTSTCICRMADARGATGGWTNGRSAIRWVCQLAQMWLGYVVTGDHRSEQHRADTM